MKEQFYTNAFNVFKNNINAVLERKQIVPPKRKRRKYNVYLIRREQ